ncbi:MAG: glycosyltransferase family 39 protein [Polyangiaceae bacterium]
MLVFALAAALSSALVARALGLRRAPELVLATWVIFHAVITTLIHVLGLSGEVHKTSLAGATAAITGMAAAGWFLQRRRSPARHGAEKEGPSEDRTASEEEARGPRSENQTGLGPRSHAGPVFFAKRTGLAREYAERGLVLALAGLAGLVFAYALACVWLLPSEGWDGIWYHETLVGWTVQTGSYAPMPLPANDIQQLNGFPRNAEMASVFWVLLDGERRFVELPNALAFAPLVAGSYLLARRFTKQRRIAVAVACVVALAPGCVLELNTTYVDVFAAAAALGAIHFATKGPTSRRDIVLAGLALGLYVGSKTSAILFAPLLGLALVARGRRHLGALGAALAFVLASASVVYARNLLVWKNPLYPFTLDVPRLGIHWPGLHPATDVNLGARETLRWIFTPAPPGHDFADIRRGGFGLAVAWLLAPLCAVGLGLAAVSLARGKRRAHEDRRRLRARRWRALTLLGLAAMLVPSVALSPAIWSARYHLAAIACAAAPAAFALERLPAIARMVVFGAALYLTAAALTHFAPPLGGVRPGELADRLWMTPAERATAPVAEWSMAPEVAHARELELGPRSTVVFSDYVTFPGVLWNEHYENRVVYLPSEDVDNDHIAALNATWLVARRGERLYLYAVSHSGEWERIGLASRGQPTWAFRRRGLR